MLNVYESGQGSSAYVFFHESVERLFSSLALEDAVPAFWSFLRSHVPATAFSLGRSRKDSNIMEVLTTCCGDEVVFLRREFPHTSLHKKLVENLRPEDTVECDSPQGYYALTLDHPVARYICTPIGGHTKLIQPPFLFLRMCQEDTVFGGATFCCASHNPFTEEHLQKLRLLRTPLLLALNNWYQFSELQALKEEIWQENLRLRKELNGLSTVEVIGSNGGLRRVMEKVRLAAPADVPVLLSGETGTGKEVIARAVHELSPRAAKPFVAVNCGGIPPTLIDSELFGHVKGAFTGAINDHKGRFERAHGGTIFLDEIGELPLDVQSRLLRVLQERNIERVGGSRSAPVDFRLVAATNQNLKQMVQEGKFREDLYYRLRVVPINMPPLRQRKSDIPLLVTHFINRIAVRLGVVPPPIAAGELNRLMEYSWPGNVRELQNVLEEAMVLMPGGPLRFWQDEDFSHQGLLSDGLDPTFTHQENEERYFRHLLKVCNYQIGGPGGAAERARLNPNTLRSRLRKLGIPFQRKDRQQEFTDESD